LLLWTLWSGRSAVHKSTAGGLGADELVAAVGDDAEGEGSVGGGDAAVGLLEEADGFLARAALR
jgi:hypothetical protein